MTAQPTDHRADCARTTDRSAHKPPHPRLRQPCRSMKFLPSLLHRIIRGCTLLVISRRGNFPNAFVCQPGGSAPCRPPAAGWSLSSELAAHLREAAGQFILGGFNPILSNDDVRGADDHRCAGAVIGAAFPSQSSPLARRSRRSRAWKGSTAQEFSRRRTLVFCSPRERVGVRRKRPAMWLYAQGLLQRLI